MNLNLIPALVQAKLCGLPPHMSIAQLLSYRFQIRVKRRFLEKEPRLTGPSQLELQVEVTEIASPQVHRSSPHEHIGEVAWTAGRRGAWRPPLKNTAPQVDEHELKEGRQQVRKPGLKCRHDRQHSRVLI